METEWEIFQNTLDEEIEAAALETSVELASRASSITRLTDEEVASLFQTPDDMQKLKDLM